MRRRVLHASLWLAARAVLAATLAVLGCAHRPAPRPPGADPVAPPVAGLPLDVPGPFQFREAFLLELRAPREGSYPALDPSQAELSCYEAPSAARTMLPDLTNPQTYRNNMWLGLLRETDQCRRAGGFHSAESQYLYILDQLRAARGPTDDTVAVMLDHVAEFYLELRDPERAYHYFADAVTARRATLRAFAPGAGAADRRVVAMRLHLADLLTRMGQIDLARSSLGPARSELTEASAIADATPVMRRFVVGLYAAYFLSRTLEHQGAWQDAERMWQAAVASRDELNGTAAWRNVRREQAAFYARRGDFHRAAAIANAVRGRTTRPLDVELAMPLGRDSRPRVEVPGDIGPDGQLGPGYSLYNAEAEIAMSEIAAIDAWQTEGAERGAALLAEPIDRDALSRLGRVTDTERAELLAWFERRVFLHMSILLDGAPAPERIDRAYAALAGVKGLYLAHGAKFVRTLAAERNNPGFQGPTFRLLDELGEVRARVARRFLAAALDGRALDERAFLADENTEQLLGQAIDSGALAMQLAERPTTAQDVARLDRVLPANTALIDTVAWDRTARTAGAPAQREYGAFVVRPGQPIRYVVLGPARDIDAEIDALASCVAGDASRGAPIAVRHAVCRGDLAHSLRRLHQLVFAPLEPSLAGIADVLVAPDGGLAAVPFAALLDTAGQPVLAQRSVAYLTSWRDVMAAPPPRATASSPPLVIGNPDFAAVLTAGSTASRAGARQFRPLGGAEAEAGEVARALGVPPERVLIGARARQTQIRAIVAPEVLHLATHSDYLTWRSPGPGYSLFEFPRPLTVQDPFLQSIIAFAGANRAQIGLDRGVLTGFDVMGLRLDGTRLVVLSSCASAGGVAIDGQGVLGLRAAFAYAGAQAVVMNLWPIRDKAGGAFMQRFYSHLADGPVAALREAQHDMQRDPRFADPVYWAGYLVSTQGRPVELAPRPPAATSAAPPVELAPPLCVQMQSRPREQMLWGAIRARWAGPVTRTERTATRAVYELHPPGANLEYSDGFARPDGTVVLTETHDLRNKDCHFADRYPCNGAPLTLTVERTADHSSLLIQGGAGAEAFSILLEGARDVFPSLAPPDRIPPLSAYTQAVAWQGERSQARPRTAADANAAILAGQDPPAVGPVLTPGISEIASLGPCSDPAP